MSSIPDFRACTKCGVVKPLGEFHKTNRTKSGHVAKCKACCHELRAQYYHDHYEEQKKYSQEIYRKNRTAMLARDRVYRQHNATKINTRISAWKKLNPEKNLVYHHKYRAKNQSETHFTPEEWQALCEKYEGHCLKCGKQKKLTVDHIVPLALGGSNDIDNIQPLCKSCNTSKGIQIIDYR